jgi:death on curing protein
MEGTGKALIIPSIDELIVLNRRLIIEMGGGLYSGIDNLLYRGLLEHALAEMNATIFEQEIYPTVYEKAALLAWRIIQGHVFHDGNKRTGMAAAKVFLLINGYKIGLAMDTVDTALWVATGQMTVSQLAKWLEAHMQS